MVTYKIKFLKQFPKFKIPNLSTKKSSSPPGTPRGGYFKSRSIKNKHSRKGKTRTRKQFR